MPSSKKQISPAGTGSEAVPDSPKHPPKRFATVGEKRNYAVSLCEGDVFVSYDDDDGYLKNYLRQCVKSVKVNASGVESGISLSKIVRLNELLLPRE